MENNLIEEFIQQTNTDEGVAHAFLQAKNWDLLRAIQSYNFIRDSITSIYSCEENLENNNDLEISPNSDEKPCVKLKRGISKASHNEEVVSSARANIALDYEKIFTPLYQSNSQPGCTFVLPNLFVHPENFKEFMERDLVEVWSMSALENNNRLNWWVERGICQRLWPLITTGDGNCLLHAASLAMWGFHDRLLTLRKALYNFLIENKMVNGIKRRWKYHLGKVNSEVGFFYSENEWEKEWTNIINLASPRPRNESNLTYESLEEVHILTLAHVLKRTIIVISDTMLKNVNGEDLSPINFGGIYMPLEVPSSEAHKSPINLIFDSGHFSALVSMDPLPSSQEISISSNLITAIPLMDHNHELLPFRFADDPGDSQNSSILYKSKEEKIQLLHKYLDIVEIDLSEAEDDKENNEIENNNHKNGNGSEREIDISLSIETIAEENYSDSNKNKASKQIHSVAKQFGSIGKSMGKKLRLITKLARTSNRKEDSSAINLSNQYNSPKKSQNDIIICAQMNTNDRHPCNEKLIQNYLDCARSRFLKQKNSNPPEEIIPIRPSCVSPGCNQLGSINNNYLCVDCYFKQVSATREGLGNSKFYTYPEANLRIVNEKEKVNPSHTWNSRDKANPHSKSKFYTEISPEHIQQSRKTMTLTKSPTPINEHDLELPQQLYRQVNTTPILASKHSYHVNDQPTLGSGSPVASAVALRSYNLNSNWESTPAQSNIPSYQGQANQTTPTTRILDGNSTSITSLNVQNSLPSVEAGQLSSRPCKIAGCNFFGASETENYCSRCYKELIKIEPAIKSLQVKEIRR